MSTILERIESVLESEAQAIKSIPRGDNLTSVVHLLAGCSGKLFTTGIGKAGYVARKAASTFSTTGTPSVFLHPADSAHGDVGVLSESDILLAFSNSGKTREVIETVHFARSLKIRSVITVSADPTSPLGALSDFTLPIGKIVEPCPLGMTPTASTTAMTALADALALATMQYRGFSREDFALRHHGGYLGQVSRGEHK